MAALLFEETEEALRPNQYDFLERSEFTFNLQHCNTSTHGLLFGALAEIVDNARDAEASKLDIYSVANDTLRGNYILCFLDDGNGMRLGILSDVMKFGKPDKCPAAQVGHNANGLKAGAMRLGSDMVLFTKHKTTMSCLLLSRSFLQDKRIHECPPLPASDPLLPARPRYSCLLISQPSSFPSPAPPPVHTSARGDGALCNGKTEA